MDGVGDLKDWVKMVSEFSSIHGYVWFSRFSSPTTQFVTFVFVFVVTFGLPIFMGVQLVEFVNDDTLSNAVAWNTATGVKYPNITVCNSLYFDKGVMNGT